MSLLFPASVLHGAPRRPARVRLLWVAAALSLLMHLVALLVYWSDIFPKDKTSEMAGDMRKSMRVTLTPLPDQAQTAPAARAEPVRPTRPMPLPPRAAVPPQTVRAAPAAPVVTRNAPVPPIASAAPSAAVAQVTPAPPQPVPAGDLSAMIEARRRTRAQSAPAGTPAPPPPQPAEDDIARRDRIVAANMSTIRAPTLGDNPKNSGGVFSIRRMGAYDAEFLFYGWNKDVNRRMSQVIEVRIGNNSTMELAVVRRMIVIVREYEKDDFAWQSLRAGRVVTLSARARDNAGLEEFLLREFFR